MDLIEEPTYLSISEEDIIGPFDQWREPRKLLYGICRSNGRHQGDEGSLMRRNFGPEDNRKIKI
jgi:hypothetical protein